MVISACTLFEIPLFLDPVEDINLVVKTFQIHSNSKQNLQNKDHQWSPPANWSTSPEALTQPLNSMVWFHLETSCSIRPFRKYSQSEWNRHLLSASELFNITSKFSVKSSWHLLADQYGRWWGCSRLELLCTSVLAIDQHSIHVTLHYRFSNSSCFEQPEIWEHSLPSESGKNFLRAMFLKFSFGFILFSYQCK